MTTRLITVFHLRLIMNLFNLRNLQTKRLARRRTHRKCACKNATVLRTTSRASALS